MTAPPDPNAPIEGRPSWISSCRYDIDAKAEGAPGLEMMSGAMMRSLLEDRFQLKIRRESDLRRTLAPKGDLGNDASDVSAGWRR
jgi:Protein of unknown function (DUF3738)